MHAGGQRFDPAILHQVRAVYKVAYGYYIDCVLAREERKANDNCLSFVAPHGDCDVRKHRKTPVGGQRKGFAILHQVRVLSE